MSQGRKRSGLQLSRTTVVGCQGYLRRAKSPNMERWSVFEAPDVANYFGHSTRTMKSKIIFKALDRCDISVAWNWRPVVQYPTPYLNIMPDPRGSRGLQLIDIEWSETAPARTDRLLRFLFVLKASLHGVFHRHSAGVANPAGDLGPPSPSFPSHLHPPSDSRLLTGRLVQFFPVPAFSFPPSDQGNPPFGPLTTPLHHFHTPSTNLAPDRCANSEPRPFCTDWLR